MATELCGSTHSDEIALMQMFLLSQSGYRVKVARMDNRLTLFYASGNMIYATCFIYFEWSKTITGLILPPK